MPPTRTRSGAQPGSGITKKVHRKPRAQVKEPTDSWELLDREGLDPTADEDHMFDQNQEHSFAGESPVDVEEVVRPVREMADKVGREVELFAETLDKFLENLPTSDSRDDWAYELVTEFKAIADSRVEELKKSNEREMREQLKKEWSEQSHVPAASTALKPFTTSGSSAVTTRKAREVMELRQWQQESDTWELLLIILDMYNSQSRQQDREAQLANLGTVHRYTPQSELWERFLLEDDLALERYKIKTWLEQTAEHQASSLPDIVSELEAKAGRGKGLWSSGWMHTREKIKHDKRLHSWPNAADSPLPQMKRSDNNEMLVTTLDPDAPMRQGRTLEKPDEYFERAIWVACWEMLRRGANFNDICAWCEERKEGWRALSVGKALEGSDTEQSSAAWRHICNVGCQSGSATEHEAAVFGLLGGNIKAVEKVCRTIDDQLWAYYSTVLDRQFDAYVAKVCPSKGLPSAWRRSERVPEQAQQTIDDLIVSLRRGDLTTEGVVASMKIIQSFLLANDIIGLIHAIGAAISQTDAVQGSQDLVFFRGSQMQSSQNLSVETQVALNPQTLRIAAHMYIVHQSLNSSLEDYAELPEDENVLVAYIQALRAAVKRSLIPTYASKLSRNRATIVLARVCSDITEPQEQVYFVRLMQEVDLNVVAILQEQLAWTMQPMLANYETAIEPFKLLEKAGKQELLVPGVKINPDLLPNVVTATDEAIVRALGWFKHVQGGWDITFKAIGTALRTCLVTGRFATARLILESYPFERICLDKSYETLGRSVANIFDDTAITPNDEHDSLTLNLMRKQARTYFELESLVHAIEMLCIWRTEEEKLPVEGPLHISPGHKSTMKEVKGKVDVAMEPIMQGILLHSIDEGEAKDLEQIRVTYLPEIVIAYLAVLNSAGRILSRDSFLDAMDLSTIIANGKADNEGEGAESNGLAECFIEAGRMRELMEVFAQMSKTMLIVKSKGRPWKMNKRDRRGRNLGMWELGAGGVVERD